MEMNWFPSNTKADFLMKGNCRRSEKMKEIHSLEGARGMLKNETFKIKLKNYAGIRVANSVENGVILRRMAY